MTEDNTDSIGLVQSWRLVQYSFDSYTRPIEFSIVLNKI
jgi:hypothetical protein